MSHAILQFRYKLLRESLDWFDKIAVIMKLFLRMVRPGLGGMVSLSLLLTGPLAPLAQARTEENKANYWTARKSVARQRSLPTQPVKAPFPSPSPLRSAEPVKETSKNWFEVASYTPVFGPRSWKRGNVLVPFVTIIQDAHDNYEAQLALSRTLAELADKEKDGPLLVCVEGAWGPVNVAVVKNKIPSGKIEPTAADLLKRGLITGEEHRAMLDDRIHIMGVENQKMHRANTLWQKTVVNNKPFIDPWLQELTEWRKDLIKSIPPPIQDIILARDSYDKGESEINSFLNTLVHHWGKNPIPKEFSAIKTFLEIAREEEVEKEIKPMIHVLLEEMGRGGMPATPTMALQYNKPRDLLNWWESIDQTKFSVKGRESYEKVRNRLKIRESAETLEPGKLHREIKAFYSALLEKSLTNSTNEHDLLLEKIKLARWISLRVHLAKLELTPELLSELLTEPMVYPWTWAAQKAETLNLRDHFPSPPREWKKTELAAIKFYQLASLRNGPMVEGTIVASQNANASKVILIAGGFHAPGIRALFRREGVMHQTVCPKFGLINHRFELRKASNFMSSDGISIIGVPEKQSIFRLPAWIRNASALKINQKKIFLGIALFLLIAFLFADPMDVGHLIQGDYSFQSIINSEKALLPSAASLLMGYLRIPKDLFQKSAGKEPSKDELIERFKKKITRSLNNSDTYEQALEVLAGLHSIDPNDEIADAIFDQLNTDNQKRYMDLALEDPRWAMELAHVIQGRVRRERNSVTREAMRLLPDALRDLDDISRIFEDISSATFNDKKPESIQSKFKEILERHKERTKSPILDILKEDGIESSLLGDDLNYITQAKNVFQVYNARTLANRGNFPNGNIIPSTSDTANFLAQVRLMRGILYAEIEFYESVTEMRQPDMGFPTTRGIGLEKGIGYGLLKRLARSYSGNNVTVNRKTQTLVSNIESALSALSHSGQLTSIGVIEVNHLMDSAPLPVSLTLQQPEFAKALKQTKTRIKDGTAPVIVALPWAQAKSDFLLSLEKTSQTPSEIDEVGGQQVVRFHAGPLFSDPRTAIQKMTQLLEIIGEGKPTVIAVDLDELVSDLILLAPWRGDTKLLQESFIHHMLAEWERLPNKPTLLFLTSEDNHSFYLPEKVFQQALRVEPTRESIHISLLETLARIKQDHPKLTLEIGIDSYIMSQIFGESSLTLHDAQRMMAWVAAQKASQAQPMTVVDLKSEIARLPVIDKLPIERRVRAVAGKVTPEIREKIYKIANELRRARASKDEEEASRKEQYLDTVLGLFFFWKNTASAPPEESKKVDPDFREQAKARFKQNYSGLDHIFDQLFDLCVLPKLGTDLPTKAHPRDIPLLFGSPGVGKTSLGHAIADMFGNDENGEPFYKFAEISLAGESDGSKITGFSSTYAKSSTGAPLQLFRQAGTSKMVLLIDELDKGNNALFDSLTRLLDQANPFSDNFLGPEFPIDLRDVQIVLTANSLEFLKDHEQLKDRVKLIHVPDYQPATLEQIATRHLLPQVMSEECLDEYMSVQDPSAFVSKILTDYPSIRSPRSIKKTIEFALREAFNRRVSNKKAGPITTKIEITPDDIELAMGPPQPHTPKGILPRNPGEVVMLASGFDDIFWVRAERVPGSPPRDLVNHTIGNIEGEMQLSGAVAVRIANKRSRSNLNWVLHTSHPDVKKSGNSAGLAMGLAAVSEQEDRSVRAGFAVTGALNPSGEVTEVAGLDEKIPSGMHRGIHSFLLPRQNMPGLLDIMVYNPSLSGVVLRKENGTLIETLVFPHDVPELIPGDPIMNSADWEILFGPTSGVRIVESKFSGIRGWQVEGTPEAIDTWLRDKPELVPLTTAPTYFLCSTIDEAIEFSLETQSTVGETKKEYLTRLGVKHAEKRTLPEPKPITREKIKPPQGKEKPKAEIIPLPPPSVSLTTPGRGRDPLNLPGITPNIVGKATAYGENYLAALGRIIENSSKQNALEGLRACVALSNACNDLISAIKRKETIRGSSSYGIRFDQMEPANRQLEHFRTQATEMIKSGAGSEPTINETIRSFLDPVNGIGNIINGLTAVSPDPLKPNLYRRRLLEHWAERYFFGREDISKSDLGLSMLALRGALDIQNGIDTRVLHKRTPLKRNNIKSPLDPIDEAAEKIIPYLNISQGGILTFTVEEEGKPFLLDSLAMAAQSQSVDSQPMAFHEINFSAPSLSPRDDNKSIAELLNIVRQARAAGGTGLVVDLDRLFDTYGNRTAGVLTKMVQLAQDLQPGTQSVKSFLPLPLIFVGKDQSYYRASDICPAYDALALVTPVEVELAVLIRRTADALCANKTLSFSDDAINFAVQEVKHTGYETALEAMKIALGQSIGEGETLVSERRLKKSFTDTKAKIVRSNTGYSLSWIKERIQLIQDESVKRLVKTYYSQLVATPQTDSNYVTLYSYLEAVARFPWDQVNAPLADPEDLATLLKRMEYAEAKFNESHFGMTEVQRIIRHILQSNWRRLNHGLPPRGMQYTFWGSPGTGKTTAVGAMARSITYNGSQGPMTAYGSWDIDMAGRDDPSYLLGFLKTYVGASWGVLYGGLIEKGLYSIFGIDEPSRSKPSQQGNPIDALTRFLDPAFRDKFTDTFIAFAVPLGPLMVVLLTNDRLPAHIEDRTTLVVIPDPTLDQLAQIGQRHTLTRVHNKFGIKPHLLTIDDNAMLEIVKNYVPHGARDLQRVISLLGATAANESLTKADAAQPIHVTRDNLKSLLGSPPRSTSRNLSEKDPLPGEVLTFIGGMPSMVQAVHFPREDTVGLYPTISPLLDTPMRESAEMAFKNAVGNNSSTSKGEIFIDASGPKEFKGASSGLAYYMAVQSAITDQPIPKGVAYLGGIEANGRVSRVSAQLLSESSSNAAKFGLTKLVLPAENRGDLETFFFQQPRLASRTTYKGKDTLRIPFKDVGPRPDWATPEIIAKWETERRMANSWNESLRSQELFNQARAKNLTLSVNDRGIQISGSQSDVDNLIKENVEFTPPLTFELIDNVNGQVPPSPSQHKSFVKIAASWIGAIAVTLILGNLINLAVTLTAHAATVTAAASSAAWSVPLGISLIILYMLTMRRNKIQNTPIPPLLSDLLRIGVAEPNPIYNTLVSEYSQSGKMTPIERAGIFGFLAPPLAPDLDPDISEEMKTANARTIQEFEKGEDFILPNTYSLLDLVGLGAGIDGAPPPVITFDWDSLTQGKTAPLLNGIAQGKKRGSTLAFVAAGKGQTTLEMADYIGTHWPGLEKRYRVVYVDSDQINKNDLSEGNKVHSEKLANYLSKIILNGSSISLRLLVSAEQRNLWIGTALDILPISAGYSVEGLLGAFRNAHLLFNIQA